MKILLALLGLFLIIGSRPSYSQTIEPNTLFTNVCDTISSGKFNKMIKTYTKYMAREEKIDVPQSITLIKLFMTLSLAAYYDQNNKYHNAFFNMWHKSYSQYVCEILGGCILTRGVVAYVVNYDLFLGPTKEMKCHNYFVLLRGKLVLPYK